MKKEKEENIWRRKILFCGGNEELGRKGRDIFGEGKYFFGRFGLVGLV